MLRLYIGWGNSSILHILNPSFFLIPMIFLVTVFTRGQPLFIIDQMPMVTTLCSEVSIICALFDRLCQKFISLYILYDV